MSHNPSEIPSTGTNHRIEPQYVAREIIGSAITCLFLDLIIYGIGWFIVWVAQTDENPVNPARFWAIIAYIIIGFTALIMGLTYPIAALFVRNFSYEFSEKFITIRYGVFTKTKTTIPYSRIQNIAIYQNIRDRWLKLYTVKIETAGSSNAAGNAQSGVIRPEGYIPAVRDPTQLEQIINRMVHQYTQNPVGDLQGKVFTDSNVVFDEFIAYFLSKMREKDQLRTNIKTLREKAHLSQSQLADRLDVSENTIKYLEEGEFVPSLTLSLHLAKALGVSIEEIFTLTA